MAPEMGVGGPAAGGRAKLRFLAWLVSPMARSKQLRSSDVYAVMQLVGQCRELAPDPIAWRRHAYEQLLRSVNAQVAIGSGLRGFFTPQTEITISLDQGWLGDAEHRSLLAQFAEARPDQDIVFQALRKLRTSIVVKSRSELIDDRAWYSSDDFNKYRRAGRVDHSLCTLHHDPSGTSEGVSLHRAIGERDFVAREKALLRLFYSEIGPLVGRALAGPNDPSATLLPPRVRQTLECLLQGDSEKQVAQRLRLGAETVHQYVKHIYRHYGVRSRGELLAHWLRFHRGREVASVVDAPREKGGQEPLF